MRISSEAELPLATKHRLASLDIVQISNARALAKAQQKVVQTMVGAAPNRLYFGIHKRR